MILAPETTDLKVQLQLDDDRFTVCDLSSLAALLPDGRQVALFQDLNGSPYGIDNCDPFDRAAVLSRGLTGTDQGRPFVAAPLLKQRFDLVTGQCLDDESVAVAAYKARVR